MTDNLCRKPKLADLFISCAKVNDQINRACEMYMYPNNSFFDSRDDNDG